MTETVISSAVRYPQDKGIGTVSDGNESWGSGGLQGILAQWMGGSYRHDPNGLALSTLDTTDETVDVSAGSAYLEIDTSSVTVDVQSDTGGSSEPAYDTTVPSATVPVMGIIIPSSVTVNLQTDTAADVHLAYATDGSVTNVTEGDVYFWHGAAPSHPSMKVGTADSGSGGTASTFENEIAAPTNQKMALDSLHHEPSEKQLQAAFDGLVVPVGPGIGMEDAVDPANTTSPVADAETVVVNNTSGGDWGGGGIILPPEKVQDDTGISQFGTGAIHCTGGPSEIEFTADVTGITLGATGETSINGHLKLTGPGQSAGSNPAIYSNSNSPWHKWDSVHVRNWGGEGLLTESNPTYFMSVNTFKVESCDPAQNTATSENWMVNHTSGVSNTWGEVILANNSAVASGTTPGGWTSGGYDSIKNLEILGDVGGNTGSADAGVKTQGTIFITFVNFESLGLTTETISRGIVGGNDAQVFIDRIRVFDQDVTRVVQLYSPRGSKVPRARVGSASIGDTFLSVQKMPTNQPIFFQGNRSDWIDRDNTTDVTYGVVDAEGYYTNDSGKIGNPDVVDLAGTNTTYSAPGNDKEVYVLQLENTGTSSAELQGVTGINQQGTTLIITGKNLTNNAVVAHDTGTSGNFLNAGELNETLESADEQLVYTWDGNNWKQNELTRPGNDLYASDFPGADLSTKVSNAIDAATNGETVIVTPKDDGTRWEWNNTLSKDPTVNNGIELIFRKGVEINDNTTGWTIDIDAGTDTSSQNKEGDTFRIAGGKWFNQATDPNGWLRVTDLIRPIISPDHLFDYTGTGNPIGIELRIVDTWTEQWYITGAMQNVDVGVNFNPSGGTSFANGMMDFADLECNVYGVKWQGDIFNCLVQGVTMFTNADGSTGHFFNANFKGTTFISNEVENAAQAAANSTGIEIGSSYNQPPASHNWLLEGLDTDVDTSTTGVGGVTAIPEIEQTHDGVWIHSLKNLTNGAAVQVKAGGDLRIIDGSGTVQFHWRGDGRVDTFGNFGTGSVIPFNDGLEVNNSTENSTTHTIADDSVVTQDLSNSKSNNNMLYIVGREVGGCIGAMISSYAATYFMQTGNNLTDQGGGTLSGTDGPDGDLNVSRDANTLYLENRTGSSLTVDVFEII